MGKNKGKGGKGHKRAKSNNKGDASNHELTFKTDGQLYAVVLKAMGDCRFSLQCEDGLTRVGHVRGCMRKKVWIASGDTVIACLREFQDEKCDVIHKYTSGEVRKLKAYGELKGIQLDPDSNNNNIGTAITEIVTMDDDNKGDECAFEFDEI